MILEIFKFLVNMFFAKWTVIIQLETKGIFLFVWAHECALGVSWPPGWDSLF